MGDGRTQTAGGNSEVILDSPELGDAAQTEVVSGLFKGRVAENFRVELIEFSKTP